MESTSAPAAVGGAAAQPDQRRYVLHLYITGMTPRSARAIANASVLCETHLQGRYDLEVIDLYQQPERTPRDQIVIASPMLVKVLPLPVRRTFGDLENTAATLLALDLRTP